MDYFADEIVALKMVSGEEVIAKFIKKNNGNLVIRQPAMLVRAETGGLTLAPFAICGNLDKETEIPASAIMLYALAKDEIATKYKEATSGIVLPPQKSIIMG